MNIGINPSAAALGLLGVLATVAAVELAALLAVFFRRARESGDFSWKHFSRLREEIGLFYYPAGKAEGAMSGWSLADPYLIYRNRPLGDYRAQDAAARGTLLIDRYGFVAHSREAALSTRDFSSRDVYRIVLSGGSTAAGSGATNNETIVSARLEAILNARAKGKGVRRVEVINASVAGYNSSQELISYQFDLNYLRPNMWIMVDGSNEGWAHGEDCLGGSTEWHHCRSHTFGRTSHLLPAVLYLVEKLSGDPEADGPAPGYKAIKEANVPGPVRYARNIELAMSMARASDVRFLHVLQPVAGWGDRKYTEQELKTREEVWAGLPADARAAYLKRLETFYGGACAELEKLEARLDRYPNCALWDGSRVFDQIPETVYSDMRHYCDKGHAVLAEGIADAIMKNFGELSV